jgi:hypothetical protein
LPPGTHTLSRQSAASTRAALCERSRLRPLGRTEAIGQTGHYRQTRHDRPDARLAPSGASPEVLSRQAHQLASRFDPKAAGLRRCAVGAMYAVQLEMAGVRGGSFDDVSSHEMTRPPSPAILPCQARPANPLRALTRDPAISSATASIVPSDRVMHHRAALAWCSATPIRHTRPCRDDFVLLPSCLSRPAALLGCSALRRFTPADG